MPLILLLAAIGLYFAYKGGHLRKMPWEDVLGVLWGLVGLRVMATGQVLIGALIVASSGVALWRRRGSQHLSSKTEPHAPPSHPSGQISPSEARDILNIPETAGRAEIIAAHRALIARLHPDRGGSSTLAAQVNEARDILLTQIDASRVKGATPSSSEDDS
ncbi:hypothetical protein [Aquisediminimonas sediminicola]|uniref:hypothetical protein n=1 Tax=Alteraquisediminimonas sediminicola TaxID=2676787 RepID=UPI001C8EBFF7|nr:hypothetical protein [Aquisediminimonas sediminicola]